MLEIVTRIKICGITNREDARAAVDYGADAIGFILVPESPRYIGGIAEAHAALASVPPFVARVAVCVSPSQLPAAGRGRFDACQFYDPAGAADLPAGVRRVRAFRVRNSETLDEIARAIHTIAESRDGAPEAILLDTYHKDKLGGSGETFNWELAVEAKGRFGLPLILAGGLTPDNVGEAIEKVRPYAVDVSGGVEAEPGRKDHVRLRAFITAARKAGRRS